MSSGFFVFTRRQRILLAAFFPVYEDSNPLPTRKNPALQDSPPAAGRFSDIIPLRRSAILPGGLF